MVAPKKFFLEILLEMTSNMIFFDFWHLTSSTWHLPTFCNINSIYFLLFLFILDNIFTKNKEKGRGHWKMPICADPCRSVPIRADLCRSVPIRADLCRSVPICADLRRSRKFFLYHQQKLLCFFRPKTVFFINPEEINCFEFVFSPKWNNKYRAKNESRLEKHACWSIFDNFMIFF